MAAPEVVGRIEVIPGIRLAAGYAFTALVAAEYLGAIAKGRGPIACLLSGGIDSALVAWLLRSVGQNSLNLTADYSWKRYSEFSSASANARALGISNERIELTSAGQKKAYRALNSGRQNSPCCHAQSPVLFDLAQRAQLDGAGEQSDMRREQRIVDQLHLLPGAERADV